MTKISPLKRASTLIPWMATVLALTACDLPDMIRTGQMAANDVVSGALARAQLTGSAVVGHAFVEADLLRANFMSDIQRERQSVETTVNRLISQASTMARCVVGELNALVVDLKVIVPDIVFWMKDRDFFIQKIDGGQLAYARGPYFDVGITGNGIGALDEDASTHATKWTIAGRQLSPENVISEQPHSVRLRIPAEWLEFHESELRFVRVGIEHSVTKRKAGFRRKYIYQATFSIALLPKAAARITGMSEVVSRSGRGIELTARDEFHFDSVSSNNWSVTRRINLPPGAQLANNPFQYDCQPDGNGPSNPGSYCGWCYSVRGTNGQYGHDCFESANTPGGIVVECLRRCEAGHATIKHVVRYTMPQSSPTQIPRNINHSIAYDIPEVIDLLPENPDGNYDVNGITAAGATFRLTSASRDAPTLGITSSLETAAGAKRITLRVAGPAAYTQCR